MDTFNVAAGLASIASLLIALIATLRARSRRLNFENRNAVLQERLRAVEIAIRAAGTSSDQLVKLAKDPQRPIADALPLARAVRTAIYQAGAASNVMWESLSDWRFGKASTSTAPQTNAVVAALPESDTE